MRLFSNTILLWIIILAANDSKVADTQVTDNEAAVIIADAVTQAQFKGLNVKLERIERVVDPSPGEYNSQGNALNRIYALESYARKRGILKTGRQVHFLVPRTYEGYMNGYALTICGYPKGRGLSYSTAQAKNILGQDRLGHSKEAMRHEMLHSFGASHRSGNNIMDQGVLYRYNGNYLKTLRITKRQVRKCLRGN